MISLNYRDARPIYEQVADGLKTLIRSGAIAENEKLPSVRTLAAELAINPNTIQRAYNELEGAGYCCSVPGKGSFAVCPPCAAEDARRAELLRQARSLIAELRRCGLTQGEIEALFHEEDTI